MVFKTDGVDHAPQHEKLHRRPEERGTKPHLKHEQPDTSPTYDSVLGEFFMDDMHTLRPLPPATRGPRTRAHPDPFRPQTFLQAQPTAPEFEGDAWDLEPHDVRFTDPQLAAAYVLATGDVDQRCQAYQVTELLKANSEDPEWLQSFFRSLGARQAAYIINCATNGQSGVEESKEYGAIIGDALVSLSIHSKLTQGDVNTLMQHLNRSEETGNFNRLAPQLLFSETVGYGRDDDATREVLRMFTAAVSELTIGKLNLSDGSDES